MIHSQTCEMPRSLTTFVSIGSFVRIRRVSPPKAWLEYFFKDCQDLPDIKAKRQKGERVIRASLDRTLTNIEYLPSLFEAITNKMVLEIDYKPFDEEKITFMFHSHYLKEYNGRWHLFGHADEKEPSYSYNLP